MIDSKHARAHQRAVDAYAADIIKAAIKMAQSVNLAYHYVRMYPSDLIGIKKRNILKSKALALVVMDHDQLHALDVFAEKKAQTRAEAEERAEAERIKRNTSPFFYGERRD